MPVLKSHSLSHRIFTPLWAIIRPWLDPVTRDKFRVLGSNYQSELLEVIDAENLPVEYGGTCKCEGGCVWPLKPLTEYEDFEEWKKKWEADGKGERKKVEGASASSVKVERGNDDDGADGADAEEDEFVEAAEE